MTMRFAPLAHLRSTQPNSHLQGMPELASVRIEIRPHQNVIGPHEGLLAASRNLFNRK